MKIPYDYLLEIERLFKLCQKETVTAAEFAALKKKMLKQVWHNEKYGVTLICLEKAEELRHSGALNDDEFAKIKQQALRDQDPERQDRGLSARIDTLFLGIYAIFRKIGLFFDVVLILGLAALGIIFPPFGILLIIGVIKWWWDTNWKYDNAVKGEVIRKAIKRSKD